MCWGPKDHPKGPIIALGTHVGDVFCWNVRQGTQMFHWKVEGPEHPVLDLCFSKNGSLFTCGESSFILQRDLASGKIIRKLKADKKVVSKIQLNTPESHLISAGRSFLKLWDLSSGEMVAKFSGHTNAVNGLELTWMDQYLFSSAFSQRIINLWSLREADGYEIVQTFSCPAAPSFISNFSESKTKRKTKRRRSQSGKNREVEVPASSFLLAVHGKRMSVWQFSLTMQQNTPLSPHTTIVMPKQDQDAEGIEILSACFQDASNVIIVRGNLVQPRFEKICFKNQSEMIKRIQLEGSCSGNLLTDSTAETSKPKEQSKEVNIVNDLDARLPARPRLDDTAVRTGDSISLEEKLEQLEATRKKTKTVLVSEETPITPSADSIGGVLLQALQSGDDQLLETCLTVDDITMIQRTVERLPSEYILPFLNTIIQKFQSKPNRASELIPWIQTIVMLHTSFLMTIPDLNATALSGLYQTVDARLNSYNKLLKLSGRLDLLLSQISYREVNYRENLHPVASLSIDDIPSDEDGSDMEDSESS
eukprot:CAMPEP_0206201038 /NCGR_PEP_ID=MMETSP0166-20121206/11273_1 /ASSEMBLY_ACC=CAM_ASM_000260 /TAXON_ID=95228 /ORGANISM="Vannella robusta, Strain DIVA3 518/3/11/1/6" /LENGTH=534 /DNA_ID=CAMNT_0053619563 /DNA_START=91 /DNA_END=1695 /DNA_ORIENTATION=+